jgi:PAS domain S-box-containing protein
MENKSLSLKNLAHDFNNIMAVIKLYAQLGLRDPLAGDQMKENLTIILEQAAAANQLMGHLAEEEIKESRERMKVLLSNLPGLAYRCKNAPGWPMDFVSEGCFALTGYRPKDFTGGGTLQFEDIIHPEDRPKVNKTIFDGVSKGLPFTIEYRIITKQGIEKHVWEKGRQIAGSGDSGERLEGFIMDITERAHAEKELLLSQEKLMSIFRVSPSGIGLVKDRIIIEVNERICEMTGYSSDELIGSSSLILYTSKESYDYVGKEKYSQIEHKGIGVVETRWRKKDGAVIDILLASTSLVTGDNSRGVIFTALDISNMKKAEAESRKMEDQLIQVQKMETIGILAGGVAHEFNNTLQVINTLTELSLMKLEADHPISAHLEQIRTSVKQSSGFVGQLLAFARKQAVNPEMVNLNDFVEGILVVLQRLFGEQIALHWEPTERVWPVRLDPVQVNQLIINLVLNARDAIDDSGMVTLSTRNEICTDSAFYDQADCKPGEYVMLAVSDTGCGIDKDKLSRIFEPFFTTKAKGKGTGLGLATVYGIVRQNDGFIIVDSKPGEGSTFKVYFPKYIT